MKFISKKKKTNEREWIDFSEIKFKKKKLNPEDIHYEERDSYMSAEEYFAEGTSPRAKKGAKKKEQAKKED